MKKVFILSIFTAFSFLNAQAQFSGGGTDSNLKLILGATGGVNLSRYSVSDEFGDFSSKSLFGYNGGVTVGLATSDRFSILLGANFIQKGTKLESGTLDLGNGDVGYQSLKDKTQFLSIPIIARYQLFGQNFGMTLGAGLSLNFGLGGTYSTYYQGKSGVYNAASGKTKFGSGINDDYKPFQAGIILSPGVIFPAGENGKFTINITWDLGLGNMINDNYRNSAGGSSTGELKNRSTIFTLGYEHRLDIGSSSR
jgi:Outer membrane protein beta-barrel domain